MSASVDADSGTGPTPSSSSDVRSGAGCGTTYNNWRSMRKDDIAMAKGVALKRLRNRVRLEASIRAEYILRDLLAEFETEFDRRVAAGEPYELTTYEQWVVETVNAHMLPAPAPTADVST